MPETIHLIAEPDGTVEVRFLYSGRQPAKWMNVEALVVLLRRHCIECAFIPGDVFSLKYGEYLEWNDLFQPEVLDAFANPIP